MVEEVDGPKVFETKLEIKASVSIVMLSSGQIRSAGLGLDRPLLNMLIGTGHQDLLAQLASAENPPVALQTAPPVDSAEKG